MVRTIPYVRQAETHAKIITYTEAGKTINIDHHLDSVAPFETVFLRSASAHFF